MLCEIAENYFNSINPLAARICGDIRDIRSAYEDLWPNFSHSEQEQIINETIIRPHVLLKYSLSLSNLSGIGGCRFASGTKRIHDEVTHASWRDEYSAPFSWKGKSQLDLCQSKRCVPALPQSVASGLKEPSLDVACTIPRKTSVEKQNDLSAPSSSGIFSGFCSRLKILPGNSPNYHDSPETCDESFFFKIKSNTVAKLQSTLRMVSEKVSSRRSGEGEILVLAGRATIVPKSQKSSPKKPSSPPPPPPPRVRLQKDAAETPLLTPNTPILESKRNDDVTAEEPMECRDEDRSPSVHSFELNSAYSISRDSIVPKSGFDFLDNW